MDLSDEERSELIRLARQAVEAAVCRRSLPMAEWSGALAKPLGCFVTLTNQGRLRGCIGTFEPEGPLGDLVVRMGREAAVGDPRFRNDPITPAELPELTVEVSVLSELTLTKSPDSLTVGEHGIYIVGRGRSGCFLPEVATDQGWDAREFLDFCCAHKAGLPAGAWRDKDVKVFLFTSTKFSA
ncbi:MAG: AmmeMemoRadiSam system protein A [Planctomycetota bacterium]|jgi:AmmeMemoRadiSam system protein A